MNGRMCKKGDDGKLQFWDEPLFDEVQAAFSPNGVGPELKNRGVPIENSIRWGGGMGIGSITYPSRMQAAEAIAAALYNDEYLVHHKVENRTHQEQIVQERADTQAGADYWERERSILAAAKVGQVGLFQGCHTMLGKPLSEEYKSQILGYLNKPTQEQWVELRGYCIMGATTLWQAWVAADENAPRSGDIGFPDRDTLERAIRHAVSARESRIEKELQNVVKHGFVVVS